jgi:hypothetical protein
MLLPQHQALLEASGISEEVAGKRPYFSATTGTALRQLGFGRSQLSVPALLIPLYDAAGEAFGYQARPDEPREIRGKRVKYETPAKQPNRIDVPPSCRDQLDDPSIPLIFTEGSRKADAAVSRGMCAVSLNGVFGWRHTNGKGGKTIVPDFGLMALNGRPVVLCFDNDAMTKPEVHQALAGLAAFLQMRKAVVTFAYLPLSPSGAKVGLDDWLAEDPARGFAQLDALCRARLDDLTAKDQEDTFDDLPEENGILLLADIRAALHDYLLLPSVEAVTAVVLWIVHTHLFDAWDVSPNLYLRSPLKRSGKTRTLEVCELLVRNPCRTANISAAAVYRLVENEQPTILMDEVDRFLSGRMDERKDAMIGLLNSSFRRGEMAIRVGGERNELKPQKFRLYTPLALAGLGRLDDTLEDRSIAVLLQRKPPGTTVAPFRRRDAEEHLQSIRRRLAAWAKRNFDGVAGARPVMPDSVTDRAADKWEPLLAIAEVVGGKWPELARQAAEVFTAREKEDDEDDTLPLRLLLDLAKVWPPEEDEWRSSSAADALKTLADSPWLELGKSGITVQRLAKMLRPFGIIPARPSHREAMRYQLAQLVVTWRQYGVPLPDWCACQFEESGEQPAQPAQPAHTPSDQGKQWAGSPDATCPQPAQDAEVGRLGAGSTDPNLPNETAGQSPFGQVGQVGQVTSRDSKTDMHAGGPPDTSLDDTMDQLRRRRGRRS